MDNFKTVGEAIAELKKVRKALQTRIDDYHELRHGKPYFTRWRRLKEFVGKWCRQLTPSYLEEAGIKCPQCGKTVMRKRPPDQGPGIRLVRLSCECISIVVCQEYAKPNVKAWSRLLEAEKEEEKDL